MASRWCGHCRVHWPTENQKCPVCQLTASYVPFGAAISPEDAREKVRQHLSRKRHEDFNSFYALREKSRVGPSPEELGKATAWVMIELDRQLR